MTRKEAIEYNKNLREYMRITDKKSEYKFLNENYEALDMAIKALEQEPCEDAINRQAVLEGIAEWVADGYADSEADISHISSLVTHLPSVTPKKKTRHWIENAPEYQTIDPPYICSECGNMHLRKTNYCDQCGARMVSE